MDKPKFWLFAHQRHDGDVQTGSSGNIICDKRYLINKLILWKLRCFFGMNATLEYRQWNNKKKLCLTVKQKKSLLKFMKERTSYQPGVGWFKVKYKLLRAMFHIVPYLSLSSFVESFFGIWIIFRFTLTTWVENVCGVWLLPQWFKSTLDFWADKVTFWIKFDAWWALIFWKLKILKMHEHLV